MKGGSEYVVMVLILFELVIWEMKKEKDKLEEMKVKKLWLVIMGIEYWVMKLKKKKR